MALKDSVRKSPSDGESNDSIAMTDIRQIIRQLAQPDAEMASMVCRVDSIDKEARTIDCSPINDEAPILGVNLQANQQQRVGICVFPVVGSYVVVTFTADGAAAFVSLFDEIESAEVVIGLSKVVIDNDGIRFDTEEMSEHIGKQDIKINGGQLGGLIIIQKLTDKLNELTNTVNKLVNAYNNHNHITTATVGTGPVGQISPPQVYADLAKAFNKNDYEDTKVSH